MQAIDRNRYPGGLSPTLRRRRIFSSLALAVTVAPLIAGAQSASAQVTPVSPTTQTISPDTAATAKQLGVSVTVMQQMQAIAADKATWTAAQQKISSKFIYAARMAAGQPVAPGVPKLHTDIVISATGTVPVMIRVTAVSDDLLQNIQSLGGTVTSSFPVTKGVYATLPIQRLEALASRSDVLTIQPPSRPHVYRSKDPNARYMAPYRDARAALVHPNKSGFHIPDFIAGPLAPFGMRDLSSTLLPALVQQTGSVDTEGDTTHAATKARSTYSMQGAGIKIGVMSDDVLGLAASESSGNIIKSATTIVDSGLMPSDQNSDPTGEGTAMMEVVFDMAPSAKVYFASAYPSEDAFAANIRKLRFTYGCDIICDDVGYTDEPAFSDGIVAQAVNDITADGGLYFSAAANSGNLLSAGSQTWEGDFVPGTATLPTLSGAVVNNFGTTASPVLYNTSYIGDYYLLHWSDPYNALKNSYDVYTTDSTGSTLVDAGTSPAFASTLPMAYAYADAGDRIYVVKSSGVACALHLEADGDVDEDCMTYVTTGNTHGHNCAATAYGVAAVPATNDYGFGGPYPSAFTKSTPIEYFSSDGPRRIFYNVDSTTGVATPISAGKLTFASNGYITRADPMVTAADGVTTSVSGFAPFYGTSCATPHAASIAGLIKSLSLTSAGTTVTGSKLTQSELFTTLTSTALDGSTAGWDPAYGYGIVMPGNAASLLVNFVTNVKTTISSTTSSKVTWTTGLPAGGTVYYGTNPNSLTQTVTATGTTAHTATVTGLNSSLAYYYKVGSSTASGAVVYMDTAARPLNSAAAASANLILANLQLTRTTYNGVAAIQAAMKVSNTGAGTANDVQITGITMGSSTVLSSLPIDLGALSSTKSATGVAYLSALPSGTAASFVLTGTDGNGNNFTTTVRVTVP